MNVLVVLLIPLAVVALVIRALLFQPFDTPSTSMAPTLVEGDHFFVAKFAYGYSRHSFPFSPPLLSGRILGSEPAYGDVVVFRLKDGVTDYVKRVVGLPGDRIQMRGGVLHINGRPVEREQLFSGDACGADGSESAKRWRERLPNGVSHETLDCIENGFYDNTPEYRVPARHYFMMGDNRDNSTDSRVLSVVGYVPYENLIGRFVLVYSSGGGRRVAGLVVCCCGGGRARYCQAAGGNAMHDKVDVLIIGSGASGAAVAWSLAETKMHVLCLEQGDWVKPTDYPSNGRDWEARFFSDFATSPNRRARPTDYPINDDNSPIKIVNFNGVGGSTIMYTAHYPRLHPSDFKVRTLDGVADDWPIGYDTLEPFFAENDRMMGVSGLAGDPAYPPKEPPMPPLPLGKSGARFGKAMNQLGWHWWVSDSTIATVDYDGRGRCINLGHCTPGCAQGAKASTDITYWPHALRAGVELRTFCRVREITVDEHGMASGVVYYDREGKEHFQPAEVVIIACNGVGTPRLMLNSVSGRFPNGIANSSGLVGKNLMLHPYAQTYGYVDEPLDGNHGPPLCLWSQEFYETDPNRDFVRGYTFQFGRGIPSILEAIVSTAAGRVPWGEDHHSAYRRLVNHRISMSAICEDLPEEHNRVTLDPVIKDSSGIPAPKIDYTISENSRKMMTHSIARAKEVLTAAGATVFGGEVPILNGGWHLLGTARMGSDPERSVVNEWGRCHDVKNLFIVDGSIWVTSGGVNPTSTIQALALYIADSIKQRLANLFD